MFLGGSRIVWGGLRVILGGSRQRDHLSQLSFRNVSRVINVRFFLIPYCTAEIIASPV